jgi:hypothetical protein
MNGNIYFNTTQELAEFLRHFTGSTAVFEVVGYGGGWKLTFTGGF